MSNNDANEQEVSQRIQELKVWLGSGFDDGIMKWFKSDLQVILSSQVSLDNARVQQALKKWEAAGFIEIVGTDDIYVRVLRRIPSTWE
jgi:hypothetical protein